MAQSVLPGEAPEILSVADLNGRVEQAVKASPGLQDVLVKGELSNMFLANSGHAYFSLKDTESEIKCVMWRDAASRLPTGIGDGAQVLARGSVGVYAVRGHYQLYVRDLQPEGEGLLWIKFQELKRKLEAEGLFAPERKRPLPTMPRRIGIVTSRDGAALRDILHVLGRRAPYVEVIIADARVQGVEAGPMIVNAIQRLARPETVDVCIIGRGGGSIEDLWAFNEEAVVRAIAACPVPTISAVGHETDTTLADYVADLRAPTPSAAAESVAPSMGELHQRLDQAGRRMATRTQGRLDLARSRLDGLASRPVLTRPDALFAVPRQRLDEASLRMPRAVERRLERARSRLEAGAGVLDAMSPLKILARGFAVATTAGRTVRSVADVTADDELTVRVADGAIDTTVRATRRTDP